MNLEISKMKQMISELRMQNSQSNEELLKLEIDSLKIELNKRITEIQTLKQEKQNMLYKINMYEKNLNEINNNNKIFREQAEERFSQYQKDIENLRNSLNIERSKEKFTRKKSEDNKKENDENRNINKDKESKEKENEEEEEEEEEEENEMKNIKKKEF